MSGGNLTLNRATTNGIGSTLRAENGGTLQINSTVANTGATVEALAGSTVDLQNGTITGGTVSIVGSGQLLLTSSSILGAAMSNSSTGVIQTVHGSSIIDGLNNAVGGQVNIVSDSTLVVRNTLTNNGSINLNSGGFAANLYVDGTVNLSGATGRVTLNNTASGIRYNGAPGTDTLNNAQIIEGRGTIDVRLNNQAGGLINANTSGQTLTVAQSVTNSGIMQASGGGTLTLSTGTITNIGGTIQVLTASTLNLSSGTQIIGGTVANSGGSLVFGSGVTLDGTDAAGITLQGAFTAPDGTSATLKGMVKNTGPISLNSTGTGASLFIDGAVTLQEAGQVTLGSGSGNQIRYSSAPGTDTLNSSQTIRGKGPIDVILNNTSGTLVDANVSGGNLTLNRAVTNGTGSTLRAENGGILVINSTVANTAATVEALAGSIVDLQYSAITGGTVRTVDSGQILLSGSSILGAALSNSATGVINTIAGTSVIDGINNAVGGQVNIASNTTLVVRNTLTNNGDIKLNSGGFSANLYIDGTVDLQDAGKITMNNGFNVIRYNSAAGTDTLNSAQTIEGRGSIDVILNNQPGGLINANVSGQSLSLNRETTNGTGRTLRASNGGTLTLNNITVTNTGAFIEAQALSTVTLSNATIIGGTLSNVGGTINADGASNTLDGSGAGITLDGNFSIGNNSSVTLKGAVSNAGILARNSGTSAANLYIDGTVNLSGATGRVTLNNNGSVIRSTNTWDTLNSSQTIEDRGTIDVIFNNTAGHLVDANLNGQSLTLTRTTTNSGTLRAENGATLQLSGGGSSTGPIEVLGAGSSVNFNGGNFLLGQGSNISGAGNARISSGNVTVGTASSDTSSATNLIIAGGTLDGPGALNLSGGLT